MSASSRPTGGLVPGLVKGLVTTARTMTRPAHTHEYPDAAPSLPPRSRGVIALLEENCTSCMLCARECPDWCIYIDSHKETIPASTPGGRDRQRNVLDRFAIDFSLCMYCGICVEVCPFDALFWSPQFEYAEVDIRDLLHEKDRLGGWMASVPLPEPLDPGAADPAELAASEKPARAPSAPRAAVPARRAPVPPNAPSAEAPPAPVVEARAAPAEEPPPTVEEPQPVAEEPPTPEEPPPAEPTEVLPTPARRPAPPPRRGPSASELVRRATEVTEAAEASRREREDGR